MVHGDTHLKSDSLTWVAETEKWLPDDVSRKCVRFCGGVGFRTFIENELRRKLLSSRAFNANSKDKPLTSYPEFSDTAAVAQDIVSVLDGLPYRYRVTVGLPRSVSTGILSLIDYFDLSPNANLCSASKLPDPLPMTSDNVVFNATLWNELWDQDGYDTEIQDGRLYLTQTAIGYSGAAGTSLLAREMEDSLRAFYGAGLSLNIFEYEYVHEESEPVIVIHREDGDKRPIITFKELEADLWSNKSYLSCKSVTTGGLALPNMRMALRRISHIYKDETAQKRLFTACIWYFRAKFSQRPLDKLLESTIAIEVILGDRETADGVGLTKLLGNRCAYMLGKTGQERDDIQKAFVEIYKLRSSIVHSGKHRADREEARVVNEGVKLCGRIIAHELKSLERESTTEFQ